MKLSLGTVQFGKKYGISNRSGIVTVNEAEKILITAKEAGIKMIDTANSYGESENILGSIGVNEFNIVSKLQFIESEPIDKNFVEQKVLSTLKRLRVNSLYGLLIHNIDNIELKYIDKIFHSLSVLKKNKLVKKVGISVYSPSIIDKFIKSYDFDIIQSPINIFDRQLNMYGRLALLNKKKIEVHARSIFLQGLLTMNSQERPKYFETWNKLFNDYDKWIKEKKILPLKACLNFVLNIKKINKIIIGVQSSQQLKQIINLSYDPYIKFPDEIQSTNPQLINPSNWKI